MDEYNPMKEDWTAVDEPPHEEPTDKDFMQAHIEALEAQVADLLAALKEWNDMFEWADFTIDFSNGVTYQGIDEGSVKGSAMLMDMRDKTKQAIARAEAGE